MQQVSQTVFASASFQTNKTKQKVTPFWNKHLRKVSLPSASFANSIERERERGRLPERYTVATVVMMWGITDQIRWGSVNTPPARSSVSADQQHGTENTGWTEHRPRGKNRISEFSSVKCIQLMIKQSTTERKISFAHWSKHSVVEFKYKLNDYQQTWFIFQLCLWRRLSEAEPSHCNHKYFIKCLFC